MQDKSNFDGTPPDSSDALTDAPLLPAADAESPEVISGIKSPADIAIEDAASASVPEAEPETPAESHPEPAPAETRNPSFMGEAEPVQAIEHEAPETIAEPDPLENARKLLSEGQRDAALQLVIELLTSNPANAHGLYLYAQLTTDRDNALQALKNALQLQPDFFEARLLMERLQGAAGTAASQPGVPIAGQPPASTPLSSTEPLLQQMLVQHQMLMQQQMVNQQQFTQQQLMNQQQLAQQQAMQHSVTAVVVGSNGLAFWVGAIAAFFGFFGVAHLINGKIGPGIVYLILGFVWDAIAATIAATLIGACVVIPLHLALVYLNAKNGASPIGGSGQVTVQF